MVKSYYIDYKGNKEVVLRAVDEVQRLPDVLKASYSSFQGKIKVSYDKDADELFIEREIATILLNGQEPIKIVDKDGIKTEKVNRLNLILCGIGLILYVLTYYFVPAAFQWIGYLFGLILSGKVLMRKVYIGIFKKKHLDENLLIFLAVLGAFALSYYIEAMLVMLLYLAADFLSWKAALIAERDVSETLHKEATTAYKVTNSLVFPIPLKEIQVGDTILIRPSEVIPLDGMIVEGESNVDMSSVSNESYFMFVEPGSSVESGGINTEKPLHIAVTKPYNEGTVNTLILKTKEAMAKKSVFSKTIEKIGRWYLIIIAILALLVVFLGPLITDMPFLDKSFVYKGLVILAVSCPWAMLLSTPIAYNYALGLGKKIGLIIKEVGSIDALGKIKTLFFTKTGILTTGVYKVENVIPYKNTKEEDLLLYAAVGEYRSNHPIGQAIEEAFEAGDGKIDENLLTEYTEERGKGTVAVYGNKVILTGSESFLYDNDIDVYLDEEGSLTHVAVDGEHVGTIQLSEEVKEKGAQVIENLKKLKVNRVAVLTGETPMGARSALADLKVRNIYGDLNIEEKVEKVRKEQIRLKGKTVGFVGDTISDGPVMVASDVSFAYLRESLDKVTSIADVVLLQEDLNLVYESVSLGKRTYSVIKQNIVISLITKVVIILTAMFAYIGTGVMLIAILIDLAISLLTILNCFRISKSIRSFVTKEE